MKRMYVSASAARNRRELYFSLGYVAVMIWLIKYISGTFLEETTYKRLQENKYSIID